MSAPATIIQEFQIGGKPCRYRVSAPGCNGPDTIWFWPMTADYGLYDDNLYEGMTLDEARNIHYRRAIQELVPGKTVVDVGTGADAIWALECAKAGATHVYAIEASLNAYHKAQEKVAPYENITLFHGFSTEIELPQPVDICVSEILGEIASSEGCIPILSDVRKRMLKPGGSFIPERCASPVAAIQLPDHLAKAPAFDEESLPYVKAALQAANKPQDLRVNLGFDLSQVHRISDSAYIEDIDFRNLSFQTTTMSSVELTITKPSLMHGFVSWLHLAGRFDDPPLDTLDHETNWYPVFWPVFWPGREVQSGDQILANFVISYQNDSTSPDYAVSGQHLSAGRSAVSFSAQLPNLKGDLHGHPFYADLFPS